VSDEERLLEIAHHLLVSKQPMTLQTFANTYFVDRSVIKRDFEALEKWLHTFNLSLISKRGTGNSITDSKIAKRIILSHLSQIISKKANRNNILLQFVPRGTTRVKQAIQKIQPSYQ